MVLSVRHRSEGKEGKAMRYIIVPIEVGEKECGGCRCFERYWCRLFRDEIKGFDGERLPACLAAEQKLKALIEAVEVASDTIGTDFPYVNVRNILRQALGTVAPQRRENEKYG